MGPIALMGPKAPIFYLFTFLPFYLYQPLAAVFLVLLLFAGTLLLVYKLEVLLFG